MCHVPSRRGYIRKPSHTLQMALALSLLFLLAMLIAIPFLVRSLVERARKLRDEWRLMLQAWHRMREG